MMSTLRGDNSLILGHNSNINSTQLLSTLSDVINSRSGRISAAAVYFKDKIYFPENCVCRFFDNQAEIKGPLGTIYLNLEELFFRYNPKKAGTTFSLCNTVLRNAVIGVSYGYIVKLRFRGTGFKVLHNIDKGFNRMLVIRAGLSHVCVIKVPQNIKVVIYKGGQLFCQGISKSELTQFATKLKSIRRGSPYRAKGIFESGEPIPNKLPGKSGKS